MCSTISAFSDVDNGLVVTKPCNVHAKDEGIMKVYRYIPLRSLKGEFESDELHRTGAGEDASDADSDEIGIFSIVLYPLRDLGLVGDGDFARVNLRGSPAIGVFRKALAESAAISSWVAENEPENLSVT